MPNPPLKVHHTASGVPARGLAARHRSQARGQAGFTAVEVALLLLLLMQVLLAVVDLARWSLAAAALSEGARAAARVAAVCDPQDGAAARALATALAPVAGLDGTAGTPPTVRILWEPSGCSASTCTSVRVELSDASLQPITPWWWATLPLPDAGVEIPREALRSTVNGRSNPACL